MKHIILALFILTFSFAYGVELPEGSTFIIRYAQDSAHSYILFRAPDGYYWRWLVRNSNDGRVNEVCYTNVSALREELLRIDDYIGIMTNPLWTVDSDDDTYSDMLEYLTDGDPHNASITPTESRTLSFSDNGFVIELSASPDMDTSNLVTDSDLSELLQALQRLEDLLVYLVVLGSLTCGLFLWRLTILSISRRNLF